jgi:hypothetical protein
MIVFKEPKFENDSYMFVIDLENDELACLDEAIYPLDYSNAKLKAFRNKDISKKPFEMFSYRPSLVDIDSLADLAGSIYTHTCEGKNKLDYNHIIKYCKRFHKVSRRCAVNFADTLFDYLDGKKNTSCLNSIHYYKDNVTLYFRASDIKNELLLDLKFIMHFFVVPVGNFKTLTVMSSTAQNIETKLSTLIQ